MNKSIEKMYPDEPLDRYNTLRTGGKAESVFIPKDITELGLILKNTPLETPVIFMGLGSNSLVPDDGINGLVVILQGSGLNNIVMPADSSNRLFADAGVACSQFARFAARQNFTNMEFMAGIPGTIGGSLVMNAGCYGWETWDLVNKVKVINRLGEVIERDKAEYVISYRQAKLKNPSQLPEYFISAEFKLSLGNKTESMATIKQLLAKRNQSQPTNYPNCGSVFRNPPNDYAARLIEACGLKGYQYGQAQISEKHANFIVNLGGARSEEIKFLINLMQKTVKQQFDITLEREVKYLMS